MKKISILLLMVVSIVFINFKMGDNVKSEKYVYKITEIDGNEIHGEAVTKKSSDNMGVFLYKNKSIPSLEVGDKVSIVWGEDNKIISVENI